MRYEVKIVLDEVSLAKAELWLTRYTACQTSYPDRIVNSLYFDDVGYSSLRDNLAGISQRRKSRIRWYGDKNKGECITPRFENKLRDGRLGKKNVLKMNHLSNNLLQCDINTLYQEIISTEPVTSIFNFEELLLPTLGVSYLRSYYEAPNGLRITFDRNINFYDPILSKSINDLTPILYPKIVMEIKFSPSSKIQVASMLSHSNLTPKRHSKYLAGMAVLGLANYV